MDKKKLERFYSIGWKLGKFLQYALSHGCAEAAQIQVEAHTC